MDPVSHAAFGRLLVGAIDRERRTRGLAAAGVLGALAPDVDAVFMPRGWDVYLRIHEIGTHTLIGCAACGLLTAAALRPWARATRFQPLAYAATIGALSHLALDIASGATVRPAWPVSDVQASLPLVAMADPYLFGLLVLATTALLWRRSYRAASIGIAVVALFLAFKGALAAAAIRKYETAASVQPDMAVSRVVQAEWATLDAWFVFDRTPVRLRAWHVGSAGVTSLFTWPNEADSDLVRASRGLPTVRNFARTHDLGFATTRPDGDSASIVLWSDVRYCWMPAADSEPADLMAVSADGTRIACGLWFGGSLTREGAPLTAIVKIGGFTQSRPVGP